MRERMRRRKKKRKRKRWNYDNFHLPYLQYATESQRLSRGPLPLFMGHGKGHRALAFMVLVSLVFSIAWRRLGGKSDGLGHLDGELLGCSTLRFDQLTSPPVSRNL